MFFTSSPGDGRLGILRILNLINDSGYELEDLEFGTPERNTDPQAQRNTRLSIVFRGDRGLYGVKYVYYNRIHSSELPILEINRGLANTYHELIPALNSEYNLFLTEQDIINGPLPGVQNAIITAVLTFTEESFIFLPNPNITTQPFVPNYSLYRPEHTLLSYVCQGFDRYIEYSDNQGGTYRVLQQTNSVVCGYNDSVPRVVIIPEGDLNVLEEEISDPFTLRVLNVTGPVQVTLVGPGLTFSQSIFNLSDIDNEAQFTITSNNPGNYTINTTNDSGLVNAEEIQYVFIDRYNTTYGLTLPGSLEQFENESSGTFTLTGYQIDPDEPITVNINSSIGLNLSEPFVLLTTAEPVATFTIEPSTPGSYSISFTNDRGLVNPNNVSYLVRPEIELTLTPPVDPVVNGIQSGFFTVQLVNGLGPVLVTPEATGDVVISPTSFTLTPAQPQSTFRVTYAEEGSQEITIDNNAGITNPVTYSFTVLPTPYITITPPVADIYNNQQSDNWTIELINGYTSVNVTILTNVSSISQNSFTLTPGAPINTFTLTNTIEGDFYVEATNSRNYEITPRINFTILRTLVPELRLSGPAVSRAFSDSDDFIVELLDYTDDVTITVTPLFNATRIPATFILNGINRIRTFKINSSTTGIRNISITNNAGIPNPTHVVHTVRQPESIYVDVQEGAFDNLIVGQSRVLTFILSNPYEPIDVTPIEVSDLDVTFNPSNFILSPAQPSREVTVTFNEIAIVEISTITTPYPNITIPTFADVQPIPPETLTLTGPSEGVFIGEQSLPFTVNFLNAVNNITVNINASTGTVNPTTLNLGPGNTTGTFTLTQNVEGIVSISLSNNGDVINPNSLNVFVQEDITNLIIGEPFQTTYNQGQTSELYSIVAFDLARPMTVTLPNIPGITFSQSTFNLTQENNSANFTITGVGFGSFQFTTSNNRNVQNPDPLTIIFNQVLNPQIVLTPPEVLSGFQNSQSGQFNLSLIEATENVTVYLQAWLDGTNVTVQAGFSNNEILLTTSSTTASFTITPTVAGNIQIQVSTVPTVINPSPVIYTATPVRTLSLTRLGSGNLTRDQKETFTVTLLNGTSENVEIIPISDTNVVLDDFSVPMILNNSNPTATFTARSDFAGTYFVGINNLSSISNPSNININVINGAIDLTAPNLNVLLNQTSGQFIVTLSNYDFPTVVTLNINSVDSDYTINIDPTDYHNVNQLLLTSTNRTGIFTIDKDTVGELQISFTNNRGLTNPNLVNVTFFDSSEITLTEPLVTRNYIGTTIGNYTVEALDLLEPSEVRVIHDLLWDDPNRNNVVLALDMQHEFPGSKTSGLTFRDKSIHQRQLQVIGSTEIIDDNPSFIIYGRSSLRFFTDSYIDVVNLSDDFNFGLGDFTIEMVVLFTSFSSTRCLIDTGEGSSGGIRLRINSNRQLIWTFNNTNLLVTTSITSTTTVPRKIVVSRLNGVLKIIVDGVVIGTNADTNNYSANNNNIRIFNNFQNNEQSPHYLGYLVVTKGVDKYSSSLSFIDPRIPLLNKNIFNLDNLTPNDTFNITINQPGSYGYYFINNNNLINPSPFISRFEIYPSLQLTHPASLPMAPTTGINIGVNNESDIFTITALNATIPLELNIGFEPGLELIPINPLQMTGSNTFVLNENLNSFQFRLISEEISFGYNLNITNTVGITNPNTLLIRALHSTEITVVNTSIDREYLSKTVGPFQLTSTLINSPIEIEPISEEFDIHSENVSLLLHFQGRNTDFQIRDQSKNKFDITNINNSVSYNRGLALYGKSSAEFNLSLNSCLTIQRSNPANAVLMDDFIFPGDFSVEFSVFLTTTSVTRTIIDSFNTGNLNRWRLNISTSQSIIIERNGPSLNFNLVSIPIGQLTNIGLFRSGTDFLCFVNGVLVQSLNTGSYIYGNTVDDINIGATRVGGVVSFSLTGLLGYLRLTKGIARHTTNHTPYRPKFLTFNPEIITIDTDNETKTFLVSSESVGQFDINFNNNNQNIVIDKYEDIEFIEIPVITLNPPSSRLTAMGQESNTYVLTISNAPVPVLLNINISSGEFVLEPTWSNPLTNEILFDTGNTSVEFTITSAVAGFVQISISNDKNITNPSVINHTFFDPNSGLIDIDERNMNLNLIIPDEQNYNLNLIQNITQ